MLHFMQLAHPRHMDIYVQNSKHKSQNTEVTSFEQITQNICIQNTMSHIGFRTMETFAYLGKWMRCQRAGTKSWQESLGQDYKTFSCSSQLCMNF